ncbi:MAG TPA: hypothetical protein PLO93_06695 [Candidatus Omnitrophota bacterium]|nr:hypothetical protein [Candidatus Omnitrophota bacterium]HQL41961.1 hypothetical protein [Candidatus Omnitrophota bacterium]
MFLRQIKNKTASLLLEALIAVSILAVSLVIIIRSHVAALRSQTLAQSYALASLLLEREMTGLIQNGYLANDLRQTKKLPAPFEAFEVSLSTKPAGASYNFENLNEADVVLSWTTGQKSQKLSASTFVFHSP